MKWSFSTRLALTAGGLTALTILLMTGILFILVTGFIWNIYRQSGEALTIMAHTNMRYGLELPDRALEHIAEQMTVAALLTAEFVAVAEEDGTLTPEEIRARLARVIERSRATSGEPLVDEFWITDEAGNAYLHTEPYSFDFRREGTQQSDAFLPLLEGHTGPIVQPMQPRAIDDEPFLYVGVPGVDKDRIVQLGLSGAHAQDIAADFSIQELVDNFVLDMDAARIVVMDEGGQVLFEAVHPESELESAMDLELSRFLTSYLLRFRAADCDPGFAAEIRRFGADVGVVTPIHLPRSDQALGLFIQHRTARAFQLLETVYRYMIFIGSVMVVLAVWGAFHLSRRLSQPITELAASVRRFGEGDLDHRVSPQADKEFQGLAYAFNSMAQSLQSYTTELQRETARRERLESELRIGAEVQQSLLPERPPEMPGIELRGFSQQASQVGGDFYDYLEESPTLISVCIGDATGHGLSSALLVSECWSVLRAYAAESPSPAELLRRTNKALCKRVGRSGRFVTLFAMAIDLERRQLRYSVAGHNPPFFLRPGNGAIEDLSSRKGLPLGIMPDCEYEDRMLDILPGDLIFCYSDGLTEALCPENRLYSEERLRELLRAQAAAPLDDLIAAIRADVDVHINGREHTDDITMVALRIGEQP